MLVLNHTKTFLRDSKKTRMSDKRYTRMVQYFSLLSQQESLPAEALDHSLKGEWAGYREFHASGDVLVIYRVNSETEAVELVRIGSHAQLFKNM